MVSSGQQRRIDRTMHGAYAVCAMDAMYDMYATSAMFFWYAVFDRCAWYGVVCTLQRALYVYYTCCMLCVHYPCHVLFCCYGFEQLGASPGDQLTRASSSELSIECFVSYRAWSLFRVAASIVSRSGGGCTMLPSSAAVKSCVFTAWQRRYSTLCIISAEKNR